MLLSRMAICFWAPCGAAMGKAVRKAPLGSDASRTAHYSVCSVGRPAGEMILTTNAGFWDERMCACRCVGKLCCVVRVDGSMSQ
jgi:hypothetical protein